MFQCFLLGYLVSYVKKLHVRTCNWSVSAMCPPCFTYLESAGSCYKVVFERDDWYSAGRNVRGCVMDHTWLQLPVQQKIAQLRHSLHQSFQVCANMNMNTQSFSLFCVCVSCPI